MGDRKLPAWLEERKWYGEGILIEVLAALNHEQWVALSKHLVKEEPRLSEKRLTQWKSLWIPFKDLPDEIKHYHREWARKQLAITFGNYDLVLNGEKEMK